ncbi:hypothetical protein FOL47_004851 [Perkinsus chesapeaki]|uniref:Peptidase C1A papain C-terminal domain-containing protein n=1 Tax=Perkinsus chesapeaki TaxID=330153 RepID=A0A7J6M0A8_PERCH|nr:hypothetical protein FOL47_004851 [Perkinsus chesapeaki]
MAFVGLSFLFSALMAIVTEEISKVYSPSNRSAVLHLWPEGELNVSFARLISQRGRIYTASEMDQHFGHFKEQLELRSKSMSLEELIDIFDETRPVLLRSLVDEINGKQNTWTASMEQKRLKGATVQDVKRLCGTLMDAKEALEEKVFLNEELQDLPGSFDTREAFPACKDIIGHVRDQSDCGSCWAFAPTEAFNDRLCIRTGGAFQQLLSPGHMIACCRWPEYESHGCVSGDDLSGWLWLNVQGVVSGGDYVAKDKMEESDGCWPYNFPKCAHHMVSPKYATCSKVKYNTPECMHSCPNQKYRQPFSKDRHYTSSYPKRLQDVDNIKKEIMDNGPVSAAMKVYEDFTTYKSGVYKHVTGALLGGHSMKIIGWGNENGEEYWLVVNSWNEEWGDNGLIKVGLHQCGIESAVLSGNPDEK